MGSRSGSRCGGGEKRSPGSSVSLGTRRRCRAVSTMECNTIHMHMALTCWPQSLLGDSRSLLGLCVTCHISLVQRVCDRATLQIVEVSHPATRVMRAVLVACGHSPATHRFKQPPSRLWPMNVHGGHIIRCQWQDIPSGKVVVLAVELP